LIKTLKDKDLWVRSNAAFSLWEITGNNFGKDIPTWENWWEKNKKGSVEKR